jgi:hypothetical protein
LAKSDPSYAQSSESVLSSQSVESCLVSIHNIPGANVSSALKIFAYVSMACGLILGILSADQGAYALIMVIAGLFWGVMLLGFATIIDLLRIIHKGLK